MSGLVEEMQKAGVEVLGLEDNLKSMSWEEALNFEIDPDVKAVVVGYDIELNYWKLQTAMAYLNNGAIFIASNPDFYDTLPGGRK